MIKKQNYIFAIFISIICVAIIVVPLFMDGMFCDALLYTSVANNMANGEGTFWFPHFSLLSLSNCSTFHEQPPLLFFIQSIFFRIFGSSIYTERIYVLVSFIITIFLMIKTWLLIPFQNDKKIGALPLFVYLIIPIVSWSYTNAINEVGMSVFTMLSIYLTLKSFQVDTKQNLLLVLSACSIFAASLSKGVPGLFPLVVPFFYWVIFRSTSFLKMLIQSFILLLTTIFIYATIILVNVNAKKSLAIYFYDRLLARVAAAPTVDNRLHVFAYLIMDLLPSIMLFLLMYFIVKKCNNILLQKIEKKWALLFICIALCGIAPLALTKVQRQFYYLAAIPSLAIGISVLFYPYFFQFFQWQKTIVFTNNKSLSKILITILFGAICLVFIMAGKPKRDIPILKDIYVMKKVLPKNIAISVRSSTFQNWGLQQYMMRYNQNDFNCLDSNLNYFLTEKDSPPLDNPNYKELNLGLSEFHLYKLIK